MPNGTIPEEVGAARQVHTCPLKICRQCLPRHLSHERRKVYSQLRQIDTSLDRWWCCKVVASLLHINVDNREKEWLEQLEQVAGEVDGVLSDVADAIER
ncbi:hypothetical protein PLIIFM63780_002644 [Purpureocillium lilacinum]|nr:hypothetical protein PLICBS_004821 [Purpureocillium lilacinum]GJN79131.1 hypothetical protein PLIIFM63780_002644 [Purpureocillium lilacinum]